MRISFLVHSLYNIGGTIKTTLTTATALADLGHDVEIATVFRRRDEPLFAVDPRFTVTVLVDTRASAPPMSADDARLAAKPSRLFPKTEPRRPQYSRLADRRIAEYLAACDADVVVGTRPGLNIAIARHAPADAIRVAQEHLFLERHGRRLERRLYRAYRRLDAVTTVSATDAEDYRRRMPRIADRVSHIPNAIPKSPLPPADPRAPVIVAAGRIERIKRYDLLIDAFARIAPDHPEWALRIYGHGGQTAELRAKVEELGLHDRVHLMGTYTPIDAEWVKGSIAAVTSEIESFGLTIVEAMGCGLPVVSTACPYGPPEIIDDGVTGVLTPPGDVDAFAKALRALVEDEHRRRELGEAARRAADRYLPERVGADYAALFERLLADRGRVPSTRRTGASGTTVGKTTDNAVNVTSPAMDALLLHSPAGSLVLRHGDETVSPRADGEDARVALSDLAAGVWAVERDGVPVTAGRVDSRVLARLSVDDWAAAPGILVPYAQAGTGALLVRSRRADWFAEVETVAWDGAVLRVTIRAAGVRVPEGDAEASVGLRSDPARTFPTRAVRDGEHVVVELDTTPLTTADAGAPGLWDMSVTIGGEDGVVAKVFDDIALRKVSHRIPERVADGLRVKPYYAIDNRFAVKVTRAE